MVHGSDVHWFMRRFQVADSNTSCRIFIARIIVEKSATQIIVICGDCFVGDDWAGVVEPVSGLCVVDFGCGGHFLGDSFTSEKDT